MKIKGGAWRIARLLEQGWTLRIYQGDPSARRATIEKGQEKRGVRYRHAIRAAAYAKWAKTAVVRSEV